MTKTGPIKDLGELEVGDTVYYYPKSDPPEQWYITKISTHTWTDERQIELAFHIDKVKLDHDEAYVDDDRIEYENEIILKYLSYDEPDDISFTPKTDPMTLAKAMRED